MQLWLRYPTATHLHWDHQVEIASEQEWYALITDPKVISSVLWPTAPLFALNYKHVRRHHPHEQNYHHDPARNTDFIEACKRLAKKIYDRLHERRVLVYVPLRGALPIWRGIRQFLPDDFKIDVYYPVTSSFVLYPLDSPIRQPGGKRASGSYTNVLELKRIRPFMRNYNILLYVDEIVSGGMMRKHVNDMISLRIQDHIQIIAVGIADAYGGRSEQKRATLEEKVKEGTLSTFFWEGCRELITEDNKFLLGVHYRDYDLGPHAVPLLQKNLEFYPEKIQFDEQIYTRQCQNL